MAAAAPPVDEVPQIPPERERNFRRKPGFDYLLVTIEFQKGKKFGLGMVHTENRVLVNKVDDDSMCSEVLKSLDRICDVEGIPVTDKELCKKQIVKGLKKDQKVSLAIERPVTKERTTQVENLLTMMSNQPPSVVLEVDVKEILARYNQRLKQGSIGKQHSALRRKGDQPRRDPPKVSLDENKPEMVSIGMDREYLQEDLEKVPVKTYETSLARLQKQDDGGKDGKSITQMLQVDAQPSEAQPPPPQPQAESQPPPQPQPPSQPQAASQPQPSSQPQQQELLTAIMTPPPQPQQQPSSQPQQQELLTAIMTPPAQPQSQPPPQSQPQQQLTAIVAPPAQSPKPEPPAEPPKT